MYYIVTMILEKAITSLHSIVLVIDYVVQQCVMDVFQWHSAIIETRLPERSFGQQVTLVDKIRTRRLTWFGHVTRMEGNRLPVVALYGQVEGTRSRGRQPKKWIDNVKEDLTTQGMNTREAVDNSRNIRIWRSLVEASLLANA